MGSLLAPGKVGKGRGVTPGSSVYVVWEVWVGWWVGEKGRLTPPLPQASLHAQVTQRHHMSVCLPCLQAGGRQEGGGGRQPMSTGQGKGGGEPWSLPVGKGKAHCR